MAHVAPAHGVLPETCRPLQSPHTLSLTFVVDKPTVTGVSYEALEHLSLPILCDSFEISLVIELQLRSNRCNNT